MINAIPYFYFYQIEIFSFALNLVAASAVISRILCLVIYYVEAKRLKLRYSVSFLLFACLVIFTKIASKTFYLVSRTFIHKEEFIFDIAVYPKGGIYLGAFLSTVPIVYFVTYFTKARKDFLKYLDVAFICHIVVMGAFRVATSFNHYHIGKETTMPWGLEFHFGEVRHEISFYETLSLSTLFLIVWKLRKKIKRPGLITLIVMAWVSVSRIITDSFRDESFDVTSRLSSGLTINQVVFILIFVISISLISHILNKHKGSIWRKKTK